MFLTFSTQQTPNIQNGLNGPLNHQNNLKKVLYGTLFIFYDLHGPFGGPLILGKEPLAIG